VFVADFYNNQIQVFDRVGTFIEKDGTKGSKAGQFIPLHVLLMMVNTINFFSLKIKQIMASIREKIKELIVTKKEKMAKGSFRQSEQYNLIDYLLQWKGEKGESMEIGQIIRECLIFMLTGSSTFSGMLTWASYFISITLGVQDKARKEILRVFPGDTPITLDKLNDLQYVSWILKETLRLKPPAPFVDRYSLKDITINGTLIPKNSRMFLFFTPVQIDKRHWKDPLEFRPERFSLEESQGRNYYAFCPFSLGPNNCLGKEYAYQAGALFFTLLLKNYVISTELQHRKFEFFEGRQTPKNLLFTVEPIPHF